MSRFQVYVAAPLHPDGWELLHQAADVSICDSQVPAEFDAILVRPSTPVRREIIEQSSRLKVIACLGAQLDAIDLDLATRIGVLVVHAPEAAVAAVAEYTFALLLALARQIPQGAQAIREGRSPSEDLTGFQLAGKTLGIIGLGRIGRKVAAAAQVFGMQVVAYDPYIQLGRAHSQSIEMIGFPELLARSDIITLHPSLTHETRGMLNHAAFDLIKPGAILINCTHADLVDEQALLQALESGRVAAAALDAFTSVPPTTEHKLLLHPHVLATPQLNQNTAEAQARISQQVVRDMLSALREEEFTNIANLPFNDAIPYYLARPYIQLATRLGRLQGQLAGGRITRLEVELLGGVGASESSLQELVRPVTATLLSGMLRPVGGRKPNWVSAPVLAYEQGIAMTQVNGLVHLDDYPNLIACRVHWEAGHRTVAGVLFGNGEARLVQYDRFQVDAYPDGYVLILENEDVPGVIGKVGTRLGKAGINIAQWRYGREHPGGKAVSFINLDSRPAQRILHELEQEPEIYRARLVRL